MDSKIFIISFVQGIGELLPISSSVNMFAVQKIFHMDFFNFPLKIALHAGSLTALLLYFRKEIRNIFIGLFSKKKRIQDTYFPQLLIGTLPVVILGYLSRDYVKEFNDTSVMGISCILFGILLFIVDKISISKKHENTNNVPLIKAFLIGMFQSIAIFPGVSRLGISLTACRMLSFNRKRAIFFSMLLGIPSISCSLCLEIYKSYTERSTLLTTPNALTGMALTAVISCLAIVTCIRYMEKRGFFAIAVYRCLIGILIWKLDFFTGLFH